MFVAEVKIEEIHLNLSPQDSFFTHKDPRHKRNPLRSTEREVGLIVTGSYVHRGRKHSVSTVVPNGKFYLSQKSLFAKRRPPGSEGRVVQFKLLEDNQLRLVDAEGSRATLDEVRNGIVGTIDPSGKVTLNSEIRSYMFAFRDPDREDAPPPQRVPTLVVHNADGGTLALPLGPSDIPPDWSLLHMTCGEDDFPDLHAAKAHFIEQLWEQTEPYWVVKLAMALRQADGHYQLIRATIDELAAIGEDRASKLESDLTRLSKSVWKEGRKRRLNRRAVDIIAEKYPKIPKSIIIHEVAVLRGNTLGYGGPDQSKFIESLLPMAEEIDTTMELAAHLAIPRELRDTLWDETFLALFPDANLIGDLDLVEGPDGQIYLTLYDLDYGSSFEFQEGKSHIFRGIDAIYWALQSNVGIAVNPKDDRIDWKFRFGDLACFQHLGVFYAGGPTFTREFKNTPSDEPAEAHKDTIVEEVRSAGEEYTSAVEGEIGIYAANSIRALLESCGVSEPKAVVIADTADGENRRILVNISQEEVEDAYDVQGFCDSLSWLVPSHIGVAIAPNELLHHYDDVLKPLPSLVAEDDIKQKAV